MKKVIAGCIDLMLEFDSASELDRYIADIEAKKQEYSIGKIGTNGWSGDSTFRGLMFDLQNGADYMGWGYQDSPGSNYYVKLIYYANNRKEKQGLHVGANTYVWGYLRFNESAGFYNYSDKSIKLWSDKDVSIGSCRSVQEQSENRYRFT